METPQFPGPQEPEGIEAHKTPGTLP